MSHSLGRRGTAPPPALGVPPHAVLFTPTVARAPLATGARREFFRGLRVRRGLAGMLRASPSAALLLCAGGPLAAQDSVTARGSHAIAGGVGLDAGLLGVKYARRFASAPLDASLGLGLAGVSPAVHWRAVGRGAWSVYTGGGALYAPIETPLTSAGTVLGFLALGVRYWPVEKRGLYLTMAAEPMTVLTGGTEGGERAGVVLRAQVGVAF